jgi:hypothetical protein
LTFNGCGQHTDSEQQSPNCTTRPRRAVARDCISSTQNISSGAEGELISKKKATALAIALG